MNSTLRRRLNSFFGPKWFQVVRLSQDSTYAEIVCEHRWFWAADICCRIKPRRGLWRYDFQCRACGAECYDDGLSVLGFNNEHEHHREAEAVDGDGHQEVSAKQLRQEKRKR